MSECSHDGFQYGSGIQLDFYDKSISLIVATNDITFGHSVFVGLKLLISTSNITSISFIVLQRSDINANIFDDICSWPKSVGLTRFNCQSVFVSVLTDAA